MDSNLQCQRQDRYHSRPGPVRDYNHARGALCLTLLVLTPLNSPHLRHTADIEAHRLFASVLLGPGASVLIHPVPLAPPSTPSYAHLPGTIRSSQECRFRLTLASTHRLSLPQCSHKHVLLWFCAIRALVSFHVTGTEAGASVKSSNGGVRRFRRWVDPTAE
jgi:hypothetical protein